MKDNIVILFVSCWTLYFCFGMCAGAALKRNKLEREATALATSAAALVDTTVSALSRTSTELRRTLSGINIGRKLYITAACSDTCP